MKKSLLPVFVFAGLAASAQNLRFSMGSCAELRDAPSEEIFTSIRAKKPDFFFWLGDNTYYTPDEWNDTTRMAQAWTRRHASAPLAELMASVPQRAIWDDHDFGPNDGDSTYALRAASARLFAKVWNDTPFDYAQWGDLRWSERRGDVLFVGLDDRSHRGPVGTQVLGKGQLEWLSGILAEHSDARIAFVAVGSQVLNLAASFENLIRYPKEREDLLDRCVAAQPTVVFLTGDRHHGEIEEFEHRGERLIEICSSPLTSKVFAPRSPETEVNTTLVGKPINEHHFTEVRIHEEGLFVEYFNRKGETIVNVYYEL
ncbi:MAG: alkaline phosphatase D family protein [Schleiferiaceae bacterium]